MRALAVESRDPKAGKPLYLKKSGLLNQKLGLRKLGNLVECLLIENFMQNGFLETNSSMLDQLTASHKLGRQNIGTALYQKYPWHYLFPKLHLSNDVTWEQTAEVFDSKRIYMDIENWLNLTKGAENRGCIKVLPLYGLETKNINVSSPSESLLAIGDTQSGILFWTPTVMGAIAMESDHSQTIQESIEFALNLFRQKESISHEK